MEKAVKRAVAENIILESLALKYSISDLSGASAGQEALKQAISDHMISDYDINQVGINRIMKIKELIDQGGDFVKTANKYGDEQNLLTLDAGNRGEYSFSAQVENLQKNEISDVIYSDQGYYIFRCYDRGTTASRLALSWSGPKHWTNIWMNA